MSLTTQIHQAGSVAVLASEGKLVLGDSSTAFRKAVEELLQAGCRRIVLNFAGITYIDSVGMGTLAMIFSAVRATGGCVALAETKQEVDDALEVMQFAELIPRYASEQEAVERLLETSPAVCPDSTKRPCDIKAMPDVTGVAEEAPLQGTSHWVPGNL